MDTEKEARNLRKGVERLVRNSLMIIARREWEKFMELREDYVCYGYCDICNLDCKYRDFKQKGGETT